jgi:hypothetical protein
MQNITQYARSHEGNRILRVLVHLYTDMKAHMRTHTYANVSFSCYHRTHMNAFTYVRVYAFMHSFAAHIRA